MASLQGGGIIKPKPGLASGALAGAIAGGAAPQQDDELLMLQQMLASGGAPVGTLDDFMASSQQMFQPQFDYLDKITAESKNNAKASSAELKALYGSLAKDIYGQSAGIGKNYDTGIAGTEGAYKNALGQLNNSFDDAQNDTASILQRLGIQEAAPTAVGKQNDMQALLAGIMQANGLASSNALRQGKQSALTFNTQQGNAAKLMGGEAQTGLQKQLNGFLQQIMGRRADISTQVNQSAQQMMGQAQTAQQQAQQDAYRQFQDERDFNYRMAKDKADLDFKYQNMAGDTKAIKLDPLGEVQRLARSLYGNDQGAANAVKAVTDALMELQRDDPLGKPTLAALMNQIKTRLANANGGGDSRYEPGDMADLQRIAMQLMS